MYFRARLNIVPASTLETDIGEYMIQYRKTLSMNIHSTAMPGQASFVWQTLSLLLVLALFVEWTNRLVGSTTACKQHMIRGPSMVVPGPGPILQSFSIWTSCKEVPTDQ